MTRIVVCALAAVAATAAGAWAGEPRRVVVTRDSIDLPAGCSPRQVAALLLRFESAFNDGNGPALDGLFAPAGTSRRSFQFFTGDQLRIFRRDELVPALLALRARGETMRVRAVDVGRKRIPGAAAIALSLLRVVSPPAGSNHVGDGFTQLLRGKAEINCARRRFYVWRAVAASGDICPDPVGADRSDVVVACSRQGRAPRAQEAGDDLAVGTDRAVLPARCRPNAVSARVVHLVRAFDIGASAAFARDFAVFATVQPYTASFTQLVGHAALRRFAAERYARGDGWTATAVLPPNNADVNAAIYRVDLRVSSHGSAFGAGGVKVVVDCRTGLIARWVGPALAAP